MRKMMTRGSTSVFAVLLAAVPLAGCSGSIGDPMSAGSGGSTGGTGTIGGRGNVGEKGGVPPAAAPGGAGTMGGGGGGIGGGLSGGIGVGGTRLRLLTQAEYRNSIETLMGPIKTPLKLTADTSVAGFVSVGASAITVGETAAEAYEAASRAVTAEVFGDAPRWSKLVGCQPQANLSDTCASTYLKALGRRAFRRALTDAELQQWTKVARDAATLAGSVAQALATATSGILQSPHFLYRAESTKPDTITRRLKFDGPSMATRLSFLLKGTTPSDALLDAGVAGQLDTPDGIRTAATNLLADPGALASIAGFFVEFTEVGRVLEVEKDPTAFRVLDAKLRNSMLEETRRWVSGVVLAPQADVRSLFDSPRTYVDTGLATLYGITPLPAPGAGFVQVTLPPERVGIFGKGSFLTVHSASDQSSPTRRGHFIVTHLLCQYLPDPPPGLDTFVPPDATLTTRQRFEKHRANPSCAACHAVMDPPGMGLENFDPIGRYRDKENGRQIDASGKIGEASFDTAPQMGAILRRDARSTACMVRNFYRHANGRANDDELDTTLIEGLTTTLATKGYVWREILADFVVSEAFRSAPVAPTVAPRP